MTAPDLTPEQYRRVRDLLRVYVPRRLWDEVEAQLRGSELEPVRVTAEIDAIAAALVRRKAG